MHDFFNQWKPEKETKDIPQCNFCWATNQNQLTYHLNNKKENISWGDVQIDHLFSSSVAL